MLENFLRLKMDKFENTDPFWFQENGATAHTTRNPRDILQQMFHGRLFAIRENFARSLRSPVTFSYGGTSKLKFSNIILEPLKN